MNKKKLIIPLMIFTALITGCGSSETDDEPDHDDLYAPLENEFEIKEGTYQKKNSEEKIIIIDQSHLQLSDMDFQGLIDHYKSAYSEFGWEPDENTINDIQEPRIYKSYDFENEKRICPILFENSEGNPVIEYFDTDGYSLVYLKEEYFLINEDEN